MRGGLLITLTSLILAVPLVAATRDTPRCQNRLRIYYFSPNAPTNTYWPKVFEIMQKAADDLNIEFRHFDLGVRNARSTFAEDFARILNKEPKPDAIIATALINDARRMLEKTEATRIPIILEGPLFPQELPNLGNTPGTKFKSWIGIYEQEDFKKGYELGKLLLSRARQAKAFAREDGKIHVLGLNGQQSWNGSILRQKGLKKAIEEDKSAVLDQIAPTNWSLLEGQNKAERMLKRFPSATVFWASSDTLAVAAANAFEKSGRAMGKNAFTGGLDMSVLGLENVKKGRLEATVAATEIIYAQLIIQLNDYLRTEHPAFDPSKLSLSEPSIADRDSTELFLSLHSRILQTDFQKYSTICSPAGQPEELTLQKISKN